MQRDKQRWLLIVGMAILFVAAAFSMGWWRPAEAQDPVQATPPAEADVSLSETPLQQAPSANVTSGFTYQGRLALGDTGQEADGLYDFRFVLYDGETGGTILDDIEVADVTVSDGLFTVNLDVAASAFTGQEIWLEVSVRPGDESGSYTTLTPRQRVQPAPYANTLRPGATIAGAYEDPLLTIDNDDDRGLYVEAQEDGIQVTAGSPDFFGYALGAGTAVEVNAENSGFFVGRANEYGVWVNHTGNHGVRVSNAGGDGVRVEHADGYGIYAESDETAVYAESANTSPTIMEAWNPNDREWYVASSGHVYADGSFNSGGADFAEMLPAVEGLEAGDVLVIGADGLLKRNTAPYEPSVVGVYSTEPGFVGGNSDEDDVSGKVPVAILGVVQVKVSGENGPIMPGDHLTTSSVTGHAMKAGEDAPPGTIIGKALRPFDGDTGVTLMMVMLQ